MRKYLVATALGLASVGATAQSITDPVTGLTWLDLTPANGELLSSALAAAPGYDLATSAQVAQFFVDEGLTSLSGYFPSSVYGAPNYPPGLEVLYFQWGGEAQNYSGPVGFDTWYTASDSGAPGTLALGSLQIDAAGDYFYSANPGSGSYPYPVVASSNIETLKAGFALVSVPAVPEPQSWALLGLGLVAVAHRRLKKRA